MSANTVITLDSYSPILDRALRKFYADFGDVTDASCSTRYVQVDGLYLPNRGGGLRNHS